MTDSYFYNNYGIDLYGEHNLYRQMNKKGITGGMAGWDKDGNIVSQEPNEDMKMDNYNIEDEGIVGKDTVEAVGVGDPDKARNIFKNEYKDLLSMLSVEQDEDKREKIMNIINNIDKKDYVSDNLGYYINTMNKELDELFRIADSRSRFMTDQSKKDFRSFNIKENLNVIKRNYKDIYNYLKENDTAFRKEIDNENANLKSVGQDAYNTANTNLIDNEKMKTVNSLIRELSNSKNKYDTDQTMRRLKDMDIDIDKIMNDYMIEKDKNDDLTLYDFVNNNKKYLNDVMRGERSETNIFNPDNPLENKDIILKNFANDRAVIFSTKNDRAYVPDLFSKVKDKIENLFKEYGKDVNISDDELQVIKNQIKNHFPFDGVSTNNVYELKSRNNNTYDDNVKSPYKITKLGSGKSFHKVNIDNEPYIISYNYYPKYGKNSKGEIVLENLILATEIFEGEWNSRYKDRNYITDKNGNKLTVGVSTLRPRKRDIIWADINKNGIKMLTPLKKGYVVEQTNSDGETDYYVDSSKINNKGMINFNYKDGYTATPRHLEKYDYKNNDWLNRYTKENEDSFITKEETKSKKKGKKGKKKGKGITGGMVEANINDKKLQSYLMDIYKANDWDDLFDKIKNDDGLTDNQKKNLLLNELGDTSFYNYDEDSNKYIKDQSKNLFKKIGDYLQNNLNTTEEEIKNIKDKGKNIAKDKNYTNPYFTTMDNLANNDPITRGDLTEDNLNDEQKANLKLLDNDKSNPLNTKDLNAYNPEFIKVLKKDFKLKTDDEIKKKILRYFPVDIIKDNTIWEIKSYGDKSKISNEFQTTKLDGYKGWVNNKNFEYKFNYSNDGKKVSNIDFLYKGKSIPTLKQNNNGYDYYWYLSNSSGTRYFSPLKDEIFKEEGIKLLNNNNIDIDDFKNLSPYQINGKLYNDYKIVNQSDNIKMAKTITNLLLNRPITNYIPITKNTYGKDVFKINKSKSNKLPPSYNEMQNQRKINNKKIKTLKDMRGNRKNKNYYN